MTYKLLEQYIKGKAEEKYDYDPDWYRNELLNVNAVRQAYRDCYTSGCKDTLELMMGFVEWMGDEGENPFVLRNGRWIQSCGNSSSWTTSDLLSKYIESINK